MSKACGNSFREALEHEFGASSGKVMDDALNIKYSLNDMLKIIGIYIKYTEDPLIDVDAFISNGYRMGIGRIMKRLKLIKENVEKGD